MAFSSPSSKPKTNFGFVLRYWRLQGTLQKTYWQEEVFISRRVTFLNIAKAPHGLRPHRCNNLYIHSFRCSSFSNMCIKRSFNEAPMLMVHSKGSGSKYS
jgi:hypothetical protein